MAGTGTQVASLFAKVGADIAELKAGMAEVKNELKGGEQATKKFESSSLLTWAKVSAGIYAAKKLYDFSAQGAQLLRLERSGNLLAQSYGTNMDSMLAALKKASQGTVSETELILSANRAMMLGVTTDAEKMANLLQVAALRGRAMGLSTSQAFNDIVTGIGRMSPLILDNLGIITNMDSRVRAWAAANGVAADSIDDATKRQILLNAVLEDGNEQLEATGGLTEDAATNFERFGAAGTDAFNRLKKAAAEFFNPLIGYLADSIEESNKVADALDILGYKIVNITPTDQMFKTLNGELIDLEELLRRAAFAADLLASKQIDDDMIAGLKKAAAEVRQLGRGAQEAFNFDVKLNLTSEISSVRDQIARTIAGGLEDQKLFDAIVANAGINGPVKTDELMRRLFVQTSATDVIAGLMDFDGAAQAIFDEFSRSIEGFTQTNAYELLGAAMVGKGADQDAVAQMMADQFNSTFQEAFSMLQATIGDDKLSMAEFVDVSKDAAQEIASRFGIPFKEALQIIRSEFANGEGVNGLSAADMVSNERDAATKIAEIVGNQFSSAAGILQAAIERNPPLSVESLFGDASGGLDQVQGEINGLDGTHAEEVLRTSVVDPIDEALSKFNQLARSLLSFDGSEFEVNINVNGMPKKYQGYNVQAIQGSQRAAGGQIDPNAITIVGERGYEMIAKGNVYPHEQARQMLPMLQALGIFPRGLAVGGPLSGGGGPGKPPPPAISNVPWTPYGGGLISGGGISDPSGPPMAEGSPFVYPAGSGPNARRREANSQAVAQAAAQVAVQAAQAAAAGVGAAVSQTSQQQTTQVVAAFTQSSVKASSDLLREVNEMKESIQKLPLKIAVEIAHELALRI